MCNVKNPKNIQVKSTHVNKLRFFSVLLVFNDDGTSDHHLKKLIIKDT